MTTKQRLHELIDQFNEATAERALDTVLALVTDQAEAGAGPADDEDALEAFFASGSSGRPDLGQRHREITAEILGRQSARDL
jgi:hypothetical protein